MKGAGLPLHGLFQALRDAGLPLGVSDYLGLLAALRAGEGADRPALVRLCKMLWTSSAAEGALVERLFHSLAPPVVTEVEVPPELMEVAPSEGQGRAGGVESPGPTREPALPPPESARQEETPPPPAATPEGLRAAEIAARAVESGAGGLDLAFSPRGLPVGEYLPVTGRQLGQSWRRLRRTEARGPKTEIDAAATVDEVARNGLWTVPVLTARRRNVARLLLFVDRDGSMAPFHPLTDRIVDSAAHGSGLGHVDVVSFHNFAVERVDRGEDGVSLAELLARLPVSTGALFLSDAGAARGRYSTERVEGTRRMIERVAARLRRLAWINPVPRARWLGTSAQDVFSMVPMFEAHRAGFDAALRVLRGRRPFPHGASPWGRP